MTSLGRRGLRALNRLMPSREGGLTVLAYHLVGGGSGTVVDLPIDSFRAQLDELPKLGRVVALEAGLAELESRREDAEHLIALTFDDAFANFYERAWPLLRERSLPATLFVPVGFVEGTARSPLAGAGAMPPMTWDQLREVAASGQVELGSHSLTHPDLRLLPEPECRHELVESKRLLAERSDRPVRAFCYPKALSSRAVRSLVREVYDVGVVGGGRRNRSGSLDRACVSRLPVRSDSPLRLASMVRSSIWLEEWFASRARGHRP